MINYTYDPNDFNFINRKFSIAYVINLIKTNQLIVFECDWSTRKCNLFVESIILRIPLEPFYLDHTNGYYKIINGSNRISALKLIIIDKLRFENFEYLRYLNGSNFDKLSRQYQRRITETDLNFHIIEAGTPQFIVDNIAKRVSH